MLKLVFLTIILYIIIQHFIEDVENTPSNNNNNTDNIKSDNIKSNNISTVNVVNTLPSASVNVSTRELRLDDPSNQNGIVTVNNIPQIVKEGRLAQRQEQRESFSQNNTRNEVIEYAKPNPWSKIIINKNDEYPYLFHIKIKIPSLNDFENWKQIIPNLSFDPRSGELIIPSKDEASALALANLICTNFMGNLSLQNILDKNLIQISVSKAKSYEVVQNKLREQIMENLYGKQFNKVHNNFEKDLAVKDNGQFNSNSSCSRQVDFKSDSFTDTFEQFDSEQSAHGETNGDIEAYDGSDYSYL